LEEVPGTQDDDGSAPGAEGDCVFAIVAELLSLAEIPIPPYGGVVVGEDEGQGVVGVAVTQAHRDWASARTVAARDPQLWTTQPAAEAWMALYWELEHWHW
jgi:hypothetical protein